MADIVYCHLLSFFFVTVSETFGFWGGKKSRNSTHSYLLSRPECDKETHTTLMFVR